jgi:hypothetical protein
MAEDKIFPKREELGESPESRMENFPPPPPAPKQGPLGAPPGEPKPDSADAAGDNDTEELAENMDDATIRFRELDADAPKAERPDPRRRTDESKLEKPV